LIDTKRGAEARIRGKGGGQTNKGRIGGKQASVEKLISGRGCSGIRPIHHLAARRNKENPKKVK